jgi:acetyl esterase/lipase
MTPLGLLNAIVPKDSSSRRIARDITYGTHPRQRLDLYAPRRMTGPAPVMIFILGGGWHSGNRADYGFAGRALAALGFLTIVPDYRVVPEVHYPAFVEDAGMVANWAIAHATEHGGDASRMLLSGHSAGAYNAVTLALDPERFGAPALRGRIKGVAGLSGPYDFYPFDVRESIDAFGQAENPEMSQPVNLVTPDAPPMFLAHGDKDTLVGKHNTRNLAQRLRVAGVAVTEIHDPELGHAGTLLNMMGPFRRRSEIWGKLAGFLRAC